MTDKPFTPQMSLIIHANIPIAEKIEGEELYRQLKEMLQNYTEKINIFGQINETLEPCCGEKTNARTT
jgi:hemoglobin-like flavoprotein